MHYIKGLKQIEAQTGNMEKYLRYFFTRCYLLAAPTPGMRDYLQKKDFGTPIAVLPTGIPAESFLPYKGRAEHIRKAYLSAADHMFCTVSRLAKEKNIYFRVPKAFAAERGKVIQALDDWGRTGAQKL